MNKVDSVKIIGKYNMNAELNTVAALRRIKGIGFGSAVVLLRGLNIAENIKLGGISEEDQLNLSMMLNRLDLGQPVFTEIAGRPMYNKISHKTSLITAALKEDLAYRNNYHKKLKGYRGRQKTEGLKCRHQRSRSTGRSNKKVVKRK